jgi:uncharacterized membrane protein YgcG
MRSTKRVAAVVLALGVSAVLPPAGLEQSAAAAPAATVVKTALSRRMPEVKFDNVGLGDAMDFIRDVSGTNIVVNWRALGEANVTRETPINLRLYGVPLRKVLTTVLSEAGAGTALTYTIDDNVVTVTTQELADKVIYTRIYPIEDLLLEIPNFDNAPDFNLSAQQGGGSGGSGGGSGGGGGGGGGGMGLFGGGGSSKKDEKVKTRDERAQEIIDLIVNTIRPDVWRDNGGTAAIRHFNGSLIVSAPQSVHEMIGG